MNLMLVRQGAPPAVIYKKNRPAYLRALKSADRKEEGPLAELIARAVRQCTVDLVIPALAGPARYVPIAALADHEMSHSALRSAASRDRLKHVMIKGQYYSSRADVDDYKSSRQKGRRVEPL